jgi:hypothetical protein
MSRKLMPMRGLIRCAALALLAAATASCGDVVRTGRSPVTLLVTSLQGAPGGATAGTAGNPLPSSVINLVTSPAPCTAAAPCRVVFNDVGSASISAVMKDVTVSPTANNQVIITSYHVDYRRTDGRNQPGVDVPYPFDGAVTATISAGGSGTVAFEIVRVDAKKESPLVQLLSNNSVINTIGTVTFFGHDAVGNDVSVAGSMEIDFGNFAVGS